VVGDGLAGVRAGSEGAQAEDLLGSDDRFQRSAAAWAQVAGVRGGISVTPDAGAARFALEVRHGSVSAGRANARVGSARGALELA
jgi:hypothetical protein